MAKNGSKGPSKDPKRLKTEEKREFSRKTGNFQVNKRVGNSIPIPPVFLRVSCFPAKILGSGPVLS